MNRLFLGLLALLTWVVGSGILFAMALLSVSVEAGQAATYLVGACLVTSAVLLFLNRPTAVFVVAAVPGIVAALILVAVFGLNTFTALTM